MFYSPSKAVRETCRSLSLRFLLDYPLGKPRLQKHINFLVKNLSYNHESGRESALEMLCLVINRFPLNILKEYYQMIFLSLSVRLVNDESSSCREIVGKVIMDLLERLEQCDIVRLLVVIEKWLHGNTSRQRMACQIYGLISDKTHQSPGRFAWFERSHFGDFFKILVSILSGNEQTMTEPANDMMTTKYYALQSISKMFVCSPVIFATLADDSFWELILQFLSHPHAWIKNLACRLFAYLFDHVDETTLRLKHSMGGCQLENFLIPANVQKLSYKLYRQLLNPQLTEEYGIQIVKLMFVLARCMNGGSLTMPTEAATERGDEKDSLSNEQTQSMLFWLSLRMASLARKEVLPGGKGLLCRALSFRWFAAVFTSLPAENMEACMRQAILSAHRTIVDDVTTAAGFGMLQSFIMK
jgi:U3 small nucleolar RNA-associated protein 20